MTHKDPNYQKKYREIHKERLSAMAAARYQAKKESVKARVKLYRENNLEKVKASKQPYMRNYNRSYFQKNKSKINLQKRTKYKTDPDYRLKRVLRSRILDGLANEYKTSKAVTLLGDSFEKVKQHIENQFKEGMTWENYGYETWHIHHIKPVHTFDLTKEAEQHKCFHYTNLQPLWAEEHKKLHATA
jgi:hypothetical protein